MQQASAEARHALEEAVEAVAMATHRALTYARRLDEALAGLGETAPPGESVGVVAALPETSRPARSGVALSRREQEVLALVAEGRSNKAIAEALFVSPNTVKTHVASLLTKLRVDSRVQLATIAHRQALTELLRSPNQQLDDRVLAVDALAIGIRSLPDQGDRSDHEHRGAQVRDSTENGLVRVRADHAAGFSADVIGPPPARRCLQQTAPARRP